MKRRLPALAAALALAACGTEPAPDSPEPSPALWELSGRHGEKAWLFGTIHALPDGADWRTPAFERAFAASDLVMVEIGDLGNPSSAAKAFNTFAETQGLPALSVRLAPADRPALVKLMQRAGMDDADFWDLETWAAALILASAVRESDPGNGVDRDLLDDGKPVEALETFAGQFARFDALDETAQRELLAGIVREAESGKTDERVGAWLTGDVAELEEEMEDAFLRQPALRETLLVERNEYFAARIVETVEERHKPFVAVGAGHMLGHDGLPALLAARGYTVRRIQ
jgi:uncharacterized protein YbaP (TraB family)